jgi:hypothetical protein
MTMTNEINRDFPNDPMLQELHDIGRKIHEELKGKSPTEIAAYYNEQARRSAERRGFRCVPTGKGTHRLERKEQAA